MVIISVYPVLTDLYVPYYMKAVWENAYKMHTILCMYAYILTGI